VQIEKFKNLEFTDFSKPENKAAMERAIADVRSQLGQEYDILIGSDHIRTEGKLLSYNPSRKDEVVGVCQKGTRELAETAISTASEAFESWSRTAPEKRVEYVLAISNLMTQRRLELAAWMVLEVGKSWAEADGDVAEAVDFIEFYAREMLRLSLPQPLAENPGEENQLVYIPLGVGVVIPPWNFPLAILTGMAMAGVVSGNTVILKPSSDSPVIAAQLIRLCEEVGLPPGVVNFLPGPGSQIGDPLVEHPKTRFISFTGSMPVGLGIVEKAAKAQPGQIWIKRVVAEMGGKDAIVVDSETDLDEAAAGVVRSTYGFQGQKCSACSRAIVVESVYDEFLEKLVELTPAIVQEGSVEESDVNFGPVINGRAQQQIMDYIETGKKEGRLLLGGEKGSAEGHFIRPTIIADLDSKSTIAQEEIFGPVLAVIKAKDYDDALAIANDTIFGLTGAVYTDDEEKLRRAEQEFHVGNLYLNRGCTGALVGIHPFGGFNMSGTDSKAGSRDYLLLFTQAKSIARKV